eukprot:TRINITY_DN12102_c0_g1::TRINITY_DN12102_c0_g1_i1::g.9650::m.9650 TRINITY_DN12102_c0_g1::TRINITY_DN12102_c0_g1_i1::g.9650  ORF type:complete len:187 (+),score=15.78,Asp_protease_2/PF13650.1/0.049 TRINITY_DN12102_c0_g1_i1:84-644(+)
MNILSKVIRQSHQAAGRSFRQISTESDSKLGIAQAIKYREYDVVLQEDDVPPPHPNELQELTEDEYDNVLHQGFSGFNDCRLYASYPVIKRPNIHIPITFLINTGAPISTLTEATAARLHALGALTKVEIAHGYSPAFKIMLDGKPTLLFLSEKHYPNVNLLGLPHLPRPAVNALLSLLPNKRRKK